jgi:hypothetical protein
MGDPLLSASPDIVVIEDPPAPAIKTTEIHYIALGPDQPQVWERFGVGSWNRVLPPRVIRSDSNNRNIDGYFITPMTAGQFYQVRLYHDPNINPNTQDEDPNTQDEDPNTQDEPRPDAEITIPSLLKSGRITLIASKDNNQGGTWYRQTVTTTVPTHFFLQVGESRNLFGEAEGNPVLRPVLLAKNDGAMLKTQHTDVEVPDPAQIAEGRALFAGNDYFALGMVIDKDGRWEIFTVPFTTKQRKVTLNFIELHIVNDGALGDTTAGFDIWVRQGAATVLKHFSFGDINNFKISDRPDPGHETEEHIPLAAQGCTPVTTSGAINKDNHDIGILVRGLCRRIARENERAANYFPATHFPDSLATPEEVKFRFPIGRGRESVVASPFVSHAKAEIADDEFEFTVTTNVTVEYL